MTAVSTLPPGMKIPANLTGQDSGPGARSPDFRSMEPFWEKSTALIQGLDAVKAAGTKFLPRHPAESESDYQYRLSCGVLTNIYADIVESLSAKPFQDELQVVDGSASAAFVGEPVMARDPDTGDLVDTGKRKGGLVENIDGCGSHLHVFANRVLYHGINAGIDWIFVDYPKVTAPLTAAEEKARNVRPYWYRIPAEAVLDVQTAMSGGVELFVRFRFQEVETVRSDDGYGVRQAERVREIVRPLTSAPGEDATYGAPEWTLWEKDESLPVSVTDPRAQWRVVDGGTYTVGEIPIVPFVCGKRRGTSWAIDPPMRSAADLQIELYQMETGLKNTTNLVCYPMLVASGVNLKDPATGGMMKVTVAPYAILNAPPTDGFTPGDWKFIEPNATSLSFVAGRVDETKKELRELGRQPLTAGSSGITVIAAAFASDKANSALQAWTIALRDALENALALTARWIKDPTEPEVRVNLDFLVEYSAADVPNLRQMRTDGDLSQKTYWDELKRRGTLGPDFDAAEEEKRLADEVPSGGEQDMIDALGGGQQPPQPGEQQTLQ